MVICDTSIIIDQLRRPPKESYLFKLAQKLSKESFALSVISLQELYAGQSTRDERREEMMIATISPLKILPYTYETAQLAGEIIRDLDRPIEFADAAIAATAVIAGCSLVTLNNKDFLGIADLEIFDLQII